MPQSILSETEHAFTSVDRRWRIEAGRPSCCGFVNH